MIARLAIQIVGLSSGAIPLKYDWLNLLELSSLAGAEPTKEFVQCRVANR